MLVRFFGFIVERHELSLQSVNKRTGTWSFKDRLLLENPSFPMIYRSLEPCNIWLEKQLAFYSSFEDKLCSVIIFRTLGRPGLNILVVF